MRWKLNRMKIVKECRLQGNEDVMQVVNECILYMNKNCKRMTTVRKNRCSQFLGTV